MNRRDLLTGLAFASVGAKAQKPQRVDDRRFLQDFMHTHIPVFLERIEESYGTIHGHISRQNPQHSTFDGISQA